MMKKIILLLLLAGVIGVGIGFYLFNKPLPSTKSMKTDYSLNSEQLLNAFEKDEQSANAMYLDKVIEVKGSVQKVEKENEKMIIYLDSNNLMSSVIFQMENEQEGIKAGDEITLKGICTGYLMDVVLVRAIKV